MPSFQEIIAFCPPSLVILIGMGLQLPALLLRCRLLLVCGALVSLAAALAERDAVFIVGQCLLLWVFRSAFSSPK